MVILLLLLLLLMRNAQARMRNVGLCIRWAELNGGGMSRLKRERDHVAELWLWFLVPLRACPGPGPGLVPGPSPTPDPDPDGGRKPE